MSLDGGCDEVGAKVVEHVCGTANVGAMVDYVNRTVDYVSRHAYVIHADVIHADISKTVVKVVLARFPTAHSLLLLGTRVLEPNLNATLSHIDKSTYSTSCGSVGSGTQTILVAEHVQLLCVSSLALVVALLLCQRRLL